MIVGSGKKLEVGTIYTPRNIRVGRTTMEPQPLFIRREASYEEWVLTDPEINGQFTPKGLANFYGSDRVYFYDVDSD